MEEDMKEVIILIGNYGSGKTESILGLLIVLAAIYGVSLMVFSLAAPHLPIFTAP